MLFSGKYKRIIILGGSGSGKSTLATKISVYTGYPIYHLDNLLLNSNWEMKDKNDWPEICKQFLLKDVGIVDGNYSSVLPTRIDWADLIIFIDISTRVQFYRIFKRIIRIKLGLDKRYGYPEKSKEKIRIKFLLWVFKWNKNRRDNILSMLEKFTKDKKIIITNRPQELNFRELFNEE